MIQRIQSIFLLLAGGASLGLLGLPFASTGEAVANSVLFKDGVYNIMDSSALMGLFIAGGAIAILTIFLFRNRPLQLKLTLLAGVVITIGLILTGVYFSQVEESTMEKASLGLGTALPVVGMIFSILAYRFIKKDEKLVKSMDRLR